MNNMNWSEAVDYALQSLKDYNGASVKVAFDPLWKYVKKELAPDIPSDLKYLESSAKDGYMVSLKGNYAGVKLQESSKFISLTDMKSDVEGLMAEMHSNIIKVYWHTEVNLYIGLWIEKGKVVADVSVNVPDRESAILLGLANKQRAIYDCRMQECIYLK
jgi:hypothetical protein